MNDTPTPPRVDVAKPPRAIRTAKGVIAQYIHELSERHAEALRERAAQAR
jgi:hypothetical protein